MEWVYKICQSSQIDAGGLVELAMRAGDFINGRIDSNVWSHRFCDAANQHVLYSINFVGNGCLQMLTVQMLTVQPVAEVPADGALQIVGGLHVW